MVERVQVNIRFTPEQIELIDKAAGSVPRIAWIVGTCVAAAKESASRSQAAEEPDASPAPSGQFPPNKQERIAIAREALAKVEASHAAAEAPKTGRDRLTPLLRAQLEAGEKPSIYPSHDLRVRHPLRDERGWAYDGEKDGKPIYVDPAKRMSEAKT